MFMPLVVKMQPSKFATWMFSRFADFPQVMKMLSPYFFLISATRSGSILRETKPAFFFGTANPFVGSISSYSMK